MLGPDGAGKSSVINGLMGKLKFERRTVKMRHLKPRYVARFRGQQEVIVVDPHGKGPRGAFLSVVKIVTWVFEEWYFTIFHEKRRMLLICDRYYHDLLVDPKRYRFGAPMWSARLIGKLMPQPRLWILLDAPAEILQARKQEVRPEETARQCQAYREFIRTRRHHSIVDASQPLAQVIADAQRAITEAVLDDDGKRG
jgi:thymidylate kinase